MRREAQVKVPYGGIHSVYVSSYSFTEKASMWNLFRKCSEFPASIVSNVAIDALGDKDMDEAAEAVDTYILL